MRVFAGLGEGYVGSGFTLEIGTFMEIFIWELEELGIDGMILRGLGL